MEFQRVFRRWVAVIITAGVLAALAGTIVFQAYSGEAPDAKADEKKAAGNEWPMFGGSPARNLVNLKETKIATEAAVTPGAEKNIKWSQVLGSKAYGGPVFAGGKIFVGTNNGNPRNPKDVGPDKKPIDMGVLMCFNESDGKFLWQTTYKKLEAGRVNDWPNEGICSSPFVEGDYLYYVSNRSEVVRAKTVDGSVDWKFDMIAKLNNFPHNLSTCSPLVVGEKVFVITSNGVDEGHVNIPQPDAPSFIALNKKTGALLWKNNDPTKNLITAKKGGAEVNKVDIRKMVNDAELLMHGQWSNPVYAEPGGKPQIIFPGGDGWIRAFDPDKGDLIWKFDCNPKGTFYELGPEATRNDFLCTPVIWKDKLYIGVGQDPEHDHGVGHLWCIDITKKPVGDAKDLTPLNNNFDPKAEVNKNSGLVWHYGDFIKPAPPKGKGRKYRFGRTMSTCAVHDGLCYAADFDGHFYCLDALTGELKYDEDTNADLWCSPTWVDGHVYIGNEDGQLRVYKHGPKKDPLNTIDMTGGGNWAPRVRATPVANNGVLYVMTEDPCRLWAISPGGK
jgi:outer membrane protein assembly factor BamB